jgi:transcriptional regulator with XRE-family HTH domain
MSQLRQQFAKRLKQAMQAADFEPKPSVLVDQFNLEHRGRSVTFQTASRWLKGEALPDPEKVQTLARLYGVSACHLLFGERLRMSVKEPGDDIADLRAYDRRMLVSYLRLMPEQRKLVRDLVDELSSSNPPSV